MAKEQLEEIRGVVKTLTFRNDENGYTVAKIEPEGGKSGQVVAVTGYTNSISEGETLVFRGFWVDDAKYGRQFKFQNCETVMPASLEGIKRFLASSYIPGVGPKLAERIVDTFGADTVRVLDEEPGLLKKIKGLTPKKRAAIVEAWNRHQRIRDIMMFLRSQDISPSVATKIYETYGGESISLIRDNPYRLIRDIRGIGFVKADDIARKLGIAADSPNRISSGVEHCLDELVDKGNTHAPVTALVEAAAELLGVDAARVLEAVESLKARRRIRSDDERIYRADLYEGEFHIARLLHIIVKTPRPAGFPDRAKAGEIVHKIERKRTVEFAELQREAIVTAAVAKCMVLTGGPGTGKTTTVRGIIDMFHALGMSVLLCAPTGRAAKRMSETTGMEAKTVHRLLEFNPYIGKFSKNEGDPLSAHAVILDEASMIDELLMVDFLKALSPYTTLVIVGDADQLPSIGPGAVLADIIASRAIPTVRLTEIFRQAATSRIVLNAHRINTGKIPLMDNERKGNFFFVKRSDAAGIAAAVVDMAARRLPASYGFDPVSDIQILAPMHKGETGVANLNAALQDMLNPTKPGHPELRAGNRVFRTGDKVMQIRNNYDKMVFNGDIGRIEDIDTKRSTVRVKFDEIVQYTFTELDDLVTAYAVSVHKSQGSEFRCVVMPVSTQHYIMLKRNLLYTAVTRARELVVLVGDTRALWIAVSNGQAGERFTSLAERIAEEMGTGPIQRGTF